MQLAKAADGRVLLNCYHGINRSATVAMAVLMNIEGISLQEAWTLIKERRQLVNPFEGNKAKIAAWEKADRGECSLPDWLNADEGFSTDRVRH